MVAPLAPNRIHSLPVQVSYHLQSSSQTFSTLFATPQQVYVHPNAGSKVDGHDEAWGAIYLKTVVQGIMMASPELHPSHPGTPDLSLYVLDPRETYLRRSRAAPSTSYHLRSSPSRPPPEVWTGKGLTSWALAEPAQGKNLITGRIIRRAEFATVTVDSPEGMSALEALAAANSDASGDNEAAWGIEISLGLKSGISGSVGYPLPLHQSVENGSAAAHVGFLGDSPRPSTTASHHPPALGQSQRALPRAPSIGIPRITTPARPYSSAQQPSSAASASSSRAPAPSAPLPRGVIRKRDEMDRKLSAVDMNRRSNAGLILPNPENLTSDQAKELLKNGTFLQMLEQITGAPLSSMAAAKEVEDEEQVTKRARFDGKEGAAELKCSNCATTRSSVWRTKKGEDGADNVRVCNACGLWFNKTRTMRPKEFWTTDEEPVRRGRAAKAKKEAAATANKERNLKRTLTQVVENDARRIATMRKPAPRAGPAPAPVAVRARVAPKPVPMTSPSVHAPKAVRNAKFAASTNFAASSPGGWVQPSDAAAPPSTPAPTPSAPARATVQESPNTALRRIILGNSMIPSLAMPLSDDGPGAATPSTANWNQDLSAFFDVDGFTTAPGATSKLSPAFRESEVNGVSSVIRIKEVQDSGNPPATSEDDVFSQLFQRTSSMGFDASSHASSPFDFSQLPPSSPPSLPSNLPHSALLLSSPSASPHEYSPSDSTGKVSPARSGSGLRNELAKGDNPEGDAALQELLSKFGAGNADNGSMNEELLALFNSFPAASAA